MEPQELLTPKEASAHLSVSEKTLERWRAERTGPPFHKLGPRLVRYAVADVDSWMRHTHRQNTERSQ